MAICEQDCERRRHDLRNDLTKVKLYCEAEITNMKKLQTELGNTSLRNTIALETISSTLKGHMDHEEKIMALIFEKLDEKVNAKVFYWIMGLLISFLVPFSVYTTVNITKILTLLQMQAP